MTALRGAEADDVAAAKFMQIPQQMMLMKNTKDQLEKMPYGTIQAI